jgi:hypothetical protein
MRIFDTHCHLGLLYEDPVSQIRAIDEAKRGLALDKDKTKHKTQATKELTYIYLALDWKSPYNQYSEFERHEESLNDSGLTEEEFNDPIFREACRKYRRL